MKLISVALKAAIANGTITTCVRIIRKDSTIFGYTDHDVELSFSSTDYAPNANLQKLNLSLRNNTEVSNQEILSNWTVGLDEDDLRNGIFDDAKIEIYRVDYTNPSEHFIIFSGKLGMIQWTDEGFRADIHSNMNKMQLKIGATYTSKCRHQLFEISTNTSMGGCTLANTGFVNNSTTIATTNKIQFTTSIVSGRSNGYFDNGTVRFISGNNIGSTHVIKNYIQAAAGVSSFTLFLPTAFVIDSSAIVLSAGCDKTFATCKGKFNNATNFGGFPHIIPEVSWK